MKMYEEKSNTTYRFEPSISPPRVSTSFDYRYSSLDAPDSPYDIRLSPFREVGPPSPKSRIHIMLSTPSPAAIADGSKVDQELRKLRSLSLDWRKSRDLEESESGFLSLGSQDSAAYRDSRSPSPEKSISINRPGSDLYQRRRSSVKQASERRASLRSRSASPHHNQGCPLHSQVSNHSRPGSRLSSKSPSPRRSIDRPPVRRTIFGSEFNGYHPRSPSGSVNSLNSYKEEEVIYYTPRFRSISPTSNTTYRRNSSYSTENRVPSHRKKSESPQRQDRYSRHYRETDDPPENRNYAEFLRSRSPLRSVSLLKDIFTRSDSFDEEATEEILKEIIPGYDKFLKRTSPERRFSSLPRLRERERNPVSSVFKEASPPRQPYKIDRPRYADSIPDTYSEPDHRPPKTYSSYSLPNAVARESSVERSKSPPSSRFSLKKMLASHRRMSDEDSSHRRPLTTLKEDDYKPYRRYSNERRERSVEPDYHDDEQRRLSEAGVRKLSTDAAAVLTDPSETDQFIIGDRVWVGGTKPGSISFIGETKFAGGEWAGVTLDQYIGKNDGSVGGIRYFQCEAAKGVFSRLTGLTREPLSDYELDQIGRRQSLSRSQSPVSVKAAPRNDPPRRTSLASERKSSTPTPKNGPSAVFRKSSSPSPDEPRIGESVVINSVTGTKYGVLRFCGKTEFGDGVFGGVELDEPLGKNDGSVAGKRYFTCRMNYGLFAPMTRISRSSARRPSATTTSRPSGLMKRSGGRESLGASSVASSSFSSKGVRKPTRPTTVTSSTRGLQEALKEKTQQVDELLREKELERHELASVTNQLNQAKKRTEDLKWQLDQLQMESEEKIHDLGGKVGKLETEGPVFVSKLEEKQKQIDDLIFGCEEESIAKEDLQSKCMTDSVKIEEMKKKLDSEQQRNINITQSQSLRNDQFDETELDLQTSLDDLQLKAVNLEAEKEKLEKKLQEKDEALKELQNVNSSLEITITEKDQKIELLQTTQISPKKPSEDFEKQFQQLEIEFQKIQTEKCHLQKTIQDLNSTVTSLENSNTFMTQKLEAQAKEMCEGSSIKTKHTEQHLQTTTDRLVQAEAQIDDLSSLLASNRTKVHFLTQENDALEEQNAALHDQLAQKAELSKQNESLKTELQQAQDASSTASVEKDQLLTDLKENIHTLESQLKAQQEERARFQEKLQTEKDKQISETTSQIEKLTHSNSDSQKKICELQDSSKKLQEELLEQKSLSSNLATQLSASEGRVQELTVRAEETQVELKQNKDLIEQKTNELQEVVGSKEKMLQEKLILEESFANLKKELQTSYEDQKKQIKLMEEDFQKSSKEQNDLKAEMERANDAQISSLQSQVSQYDDKQKLLQESIARYEEKLSISSSSTSEQLLVLNQQLSKAEEDLMQKKMQTQSLTRDFEDYKKKLSDKSQEYTRICDEKLKLMADLESTRDQINKMKDSHSSAVAELKASLAQRQTDIDQLRQSKDHNEETIQKLNVVNDAQALEVKKLLEEKSKMTNEAADHQKTINDLKDSEKALTEKMQTLSNEKASLEKSKQELLNQLDEMKNNVEEIIRLKQSLEDAVATWQKRNVDINSEKQKLEKDLESLQITNEKLTAHTDAQIQSLKSQLEESSATSGEDLQKQQTKVSELMEKVSKMESNLSLRNEELGESRDRNVKLEEQTNKLSLELQEATSKMSSLRQLLNECECVIKEKDDRLNDVESKISDLVSTKEQMKELLDKSETDHQETIKVLEQQSETRMDKMKQDLISTTEELVHKSSLAKELQAKLEKLAQSVVTMQSQLEAKMTDLKKEQEHLLLDKERLESLVASLRRDANENLAKLRQYESEDNEVANAQLRLQLVQLKKDNRTLQEELDAAKESQVLNSGDDQQRELLVCLKSERDELKTQVNFLNPIIADQQAQKIESEQQLQQTPTKSDKGKRKAAPRMFCDICDCFDAHETEDCPEQTQEQPLETRHHEDRGQMRPYCTSCEVFGHADGECPDDTF